LPNAELGVFGGSGFYSFLDHVEEVTLDTPWGAPSAPLSIGEVGGRRVAFLPRHGRNHSLLPSRVPYRANLWAMHEVGVTRVFGPCAVGSLQRHVARGHIVVCDQLVDRTWGRADTFFEGPDVVHVSFADPYCDELRGVAADAARGHGFEVHDRGTVVVVQGPRFSTRAESAWYRSQGFEVINMTQHPEAYLARELGLCYATLALVTDYDAPPRTNGASSGIDDIAAVTMEQVLAVFDQNMGRLRQVLTTALAATPLERACSCAGAAGGKVPTPRGAK
jgi:5'-methylthioadenosine phosphorylase